MIVLSIRFLAGRFHANPWGEHVNSGTTEWPPTPWRILRAIASAALRTGSVDVDRLAAVLQSLAGELPEYWSPTISRGHWRAYAKSLVNSPANRNAANLVHDSFVVLPSPEQSLEVVWPTMDLDPGNLDWLSQTVRKVGYLGRSESVCDMTLRETVPDVAGLHRIAPVETGAEGDLVRLLAPVADAPLVDLLRTTKDLRDRMRQLIPPGSRFVAYAMPPATTSEGRANARVTAEGRPGDQALGALLRVSARVRPLLHQALAIGQTMRSATMAQYGRYHAGHVSPALSGHDADGAPLTGHDHAHYLPLDSDGDGFVDHILVLAPGGIADDEMAAVCRVDGLAFPRFLELDPVRLTLIEFLDPSDDAHWRRGWRSEAWVSHTPLAPVRHPHLRRNADGERVVRESPGDQVLLELQRHGHPAPVTMDNLTRDRVDWLRFSAPRESSWTRSLFGFRLRFDRPVLGPIALGRGAHVGLGTFVPERT